ncbi:MAG: trimethylamine methyltransferase family protein [Anaerolineae bacterium]
MNKTNVVRPHLTLLHQEQIQLIHEYSLQILSSVGVRVDSERARQIFARAIGPAAIDGDRVRIPRELVEWALQSTPSTVDIYDRQGHPVFRLPDQTRFGIGVTPCTIRIP